MSQNTAVIVELQSANLVSRSVLLVKPSGVRTVFLHKYSIGFVHSISPLRFRSNNSESRVKTYLISFVLFPYSMKSCVPLNSLSA